MIRFVISQEQAHRNLFALVFPYQLLSSRKYVHDTPVNTLKLTYFAAHISIFSFCRLLMDRFELHPDRAPRLDV